MFLPAFAIASVARGISQFLLGWFALVLAVISEQMLLWPVMSSSGAAVVSEALDNSIVVAMVPAAGITVTNTPCVAQI
jgi:hypothetical protein